MCDGLNGLTDSHAAGPMLASILDVIWTLKNYLLIFIGFSVVIFFHELGHFMAAKACNVRVHKFAIGFFKTLVSYRRGIGVRWGSSYDEYQRLLLRHMTQKRGGEAPAEGLAAFKDVEVAEATQELGIGETEYCFNAMPLGGYVKMLGQEDFELDKSSELAVKDDPRAFTNKSVGQRMIIVSAGVIMNVVFAAFVFMLTFMIGIKLPPSEVGWLKPGSPAERAGLRVGDKIVRINNTPISDQNDLKSAIVLSNPDKPLKLTYKRQMPDTGEVKTETITIRPEKDLELNVLQIGVAPPLSTEIGLVIPDPLLPENQQLSKGDTIVAVNGQPIENLRQFSYMLADLKGDFAEVKVRRPKEGTSEENPEYVERTVKWRAGVLFEPTGRFGRDSCHLLGLAPRVRVAEVIPDQRASQAGMQLGDVIVRWGNQIAPRIDEINASIEKNPETPIPVTVFRRQYGESQTVQLTITPKVRGWFVKSKPSIGAELNAHENDELVVSDIIAKGAGDSPTPAAPLKEVIPRGARITRVAGQPVEAWHEVAQRFVALAGSDVEITWTYEDQPERTSSLYIPHTLGTTFSLPGAREIASIDGVSRVEVEVNGRRKLTSTNLWDGARQVLEERVGQTVPVEYWDEATLEKHVDQLTITPEMVNTWVLRVHYHVDDVRTGFAMVMVREPNPAKAMMIGIRKTYYFVGQVYLTMQRMIITRSMELDQVSGPVGIIKLGSDLAGAGLPILLFFLALISANLAVLNFLPLPIFDGGLFVFLIIEKIKGRPVSLKVQVATQMIGLALIVGMFLFVTFQDIAKLAGWG